MNIEKEIEEIIEKTKNNIAKWGIQPNDILLLAMMEELGELSQAYLHFKYENGQYGRIKEELYDLIALTFAMLDNLCYKKGEDIK